MGYMDRYYPANVRDNPPATDRAILRRT